MIESLKRFWRALRHQLKRTEVEEHDGFRLFRYRGADGSFDYERYRQIQTEGNKKKLEKVWAVEDNIAFLSEYVRDHVREPKFGLCHGTRRGKEQEWFRKHLGCEVLGTEISDTATQFPHTLQWDFHEVKPEWIDAVDFIYSNSLDHSYDPKKALDAWMRCVRPGGVCLLEHTSRHEHATELDPFGASIDEMPGLIEAWGEGRYRVETILDAPVAAPSLRYCRYLVLVR
ncbi:MAG: methyltransferase domain-containing protein [Gammaproteobacteria bacterium]